MEEYVVVGTDDTDCNVNFRPFLKAGDCPLPCDVIREPTKWGGDTLFCFGEFDFKENIEERAGSGPFRIAGMASSEDPPIFEQKNIEPS